MLCSQLLQISTIGAVSITDANSILFDHSVTKKLEQTQHRQATDASQVVTFANAGAECKLPSISRSVRKTASISQRNQKVGLENKKFASSIQVNTQTIPTVHPQIDKEIHLFRKKLKTNNKVDPLPRGRNTPNPLFRQRVNKRPAVTSNDLPYVGSVAVPLPQWTQNGTPHNIFLTSQQFGLSSPLSGGVTYSNVTGIFLNAQYILALADQVALGMIGEYGPG